VDSADLWTARDMSGAYAELEHPADLFLEIRARNLPELFENALFAFYDQVADLRGMAADRELLIEASGPSVPETLRNLLTEVLYHFDTEGFVGAAATVNVESTDASGLRVVAHVFGHPADRAHNALLTEVKAITYHRLEATPEAGGGWRATVLLDV
jgi:SHS2 domain-containing protein